MKTTYYTHWDKEINRLYRIIKKIEYKLKHWGSSRNTPIFDNCIRQLQEAEEKRTDLLNTRLEWKKAQRRRIKLIKQSKEIQKR